jgi:inward rectifier potassium channel
MVESSLACRGMKKSTPIQVTAGKIQFIKLNAGSTSWRDPYHWILSLSWPGFVGAIVGMFLLTNLLFAGLYRLERDCIAEMPDSFLGAFFFSAETLATVGYGFMHPQTPYGNIIVTIELTVGMFLIALLTGLVFVRFSRPTARLWFSDQLVVSNIDGKPTIMLRVANLRDHSLTQVQFRLTYHQDEPILEGDSVRRFYELELNVASLILFPAALLLRHTIDERSPLYGKTQADLAKADARFIAAITCTDTVINAVMNDHCGYAAEDVKFGQKFVEVYQEDGQGRLTVDYARLSELEPAPVTLAH